MKFSLLMSLYDGEKPEYFSECMNSIRTQHIQPEEIILIIDGPLREELESELFKYQKLISNLKVYRLKNNVGLQHALNYGIKFCSYEWIFRMDTDDICDPRRFELQAAYIISHPEIELFGGQVTEFINEKSNCIASRLVPTSGRDILKFAETRCPFNHMTVAYKKSLILSVGGYPDIRYLEDYGLWLKVLARKSHKVANMSQSLVFVRVGEDMIERRRGIKYVLSEFCLAKLKIDLRFSNPAVVWLIFILRSFARLLPKKILKTVYSRIHC